MQYALSSSKSISPVYPAVFTTSSPKQGFAVTTGAMLISDTKYNAPKRTNAHEMLHTFGVKDNGYRSGGLLNSPPMHITPEEVEQVWNNCVEK